MKRWIYYLLPILLLALALHPMWNRTDSMTEKADQLLESLSKKKKALVIKSFEDAKREDWHFLPEGSYQRQGLALSELNDEQDQLVFELLQVALSAEGYDKVKTIMSLEAILKTLEPNNPTRDPEQYHIAFFGEPSKKEPWSWTFQGHHVALNYTLVNGKIASSPTFLGSNPGEVKSGEHKGLRVLKTEEDLGFHLINDLSPEQQKKAIIMTEAPVEIVTGPASKVDPLEPAGVAFKDMEVGHQALLRSIIEVYLDVMPIDIEAKRREKINLHGWDDIHFAWAGALEPGIGHYYRIQGPTFLIEFDNVQNGANHIHTIWRDFDGDFGRDLLREHYERDH